MSCPGYHPKQSDLVLTGAAETHFQRTALDVRSVAQVLQTPTMVALDWQRSIRDRRSFKCLRYMLVKGLTSRERLLSFRRVAFPLLAPYATAYRAVIDVRVRGRRVRFLYDIVVLGRNRTELTLSVMAPAAAKAALPVADVRLAGIMLARARA
jgi:hypothetical protein